MVCKDTLRIKHLPKELTEAQKEDFIRHFGAYKVKVITSKAKAKSIVYAKFENEDISKNVMSRLHQINILNCRLCVEYAETDILQGQLTVQRVDDASDRPDKRFFKNFINNINAFNDSVGFYQPPPSHLKYNYPKANRSTINNIAHALATVPRFYTQVLHLMNKMSLPPPFAMPEPPVRTIPAGQVSQPLVKSKKADLVAEKRKAPSSSESELESDEEMDKRREIIPEKRVITQKRPVKRPKFIKQPLVQTTNTPSKPMEKPENVFEKVDVQPQRKIELKLMPDPVDENVNKSKPVVSEKTIAPRKLKDSTKKDPPTLKPAIKSVEKPSEDIFEIEKMSLPTRDNKKSQEKSQTPVFNDTSTAESKPTPKILDNIPSPKIIKTKPSTRNTDISTETQSKSEIIETKSNSKINETSTDAKPKSKIIQTEPNSEITETKSNPKILDTKFKSKIIESKPEQTIIDVKLTNIDQIITPKMVQTKPIEETPKEQAWKKVTEVDFTPKAPECKTNISNDRVLRSQKVVPTIKTEPIVPDTKINKPEKEVLPQPTESISNIQAINDKIIQQNMTSETDIEMKSHVQDTPQKMEISQESSHQQLNIDPFIHTEEKTLDNPELKTEAPESSEDEYPCISLEELAANQVTDLSVMTVFKNYNPGEPTNKLYIKNCARTVVVQDLEYIYNRYREELTEGRPTEFNIRLMQEGRMKGQAFVTLDSVEQAQKAVKETNGFILKDKPLVVVFGRAGKKK